MDFNSLYKENFEKLQVFCSRWTGNIDDGRDISQESFTALLQKLNSGEAIEKPLSWLYRVAYNRCVNHHKYQRRFIGNKAGLVAERTDDNTQIQHVERVQSVRKALTRLNDKERALVTLYKHGFSYAEMAEVVEMNPASVGKTLTRAIDKLSKWVR